MSQWEAGARPRAPTFVAQSLDPKVSYLVAVLLCAPRYVPDLSELLFPHRLGPQGDIGSPEGSLRTEAADPPSLHSELQFVCEVEKPAACLPPRAAGQVKREMTHKWCLQQGRAHQAPEPVGLQLG